MRCKNVERMKFKETESCTDFTNDQQEGNLKQNHNLYHQNYCFFCFWCEKKSNRNEKLSFQRYEVSEIMYEIFILQYSETNSSF